MSRSRTKARAEKAQPEPAPAVVAEPPVVQVVEIVPGRLTESTWNSMLAQEDDEEAVADIVEEILKKVLDKCYKNHLKKQLIPYSVSWAENTLVDTLQCFFMARDEGDNAEHDLFWQEDPEPRPCAIDSWAEGCVPMIHASPERNHTALRQHIFHSPGEQRIIQMFSKPPIPKPDTYT